MRAPGVRQGHDELGGRQPRIGRVLVIRPVVGRVVVIAGRLVREAGDLDLTAGLVQQVRDGAEVPAARADRGYQFGHRGQGVVTLNYDVNAGVLDQLFSEVSGGNTAEDGKRLGMDLFQFGRELDS